MNVLSTNSFNKSNLPLVLFGLLAGVVGTVILMPRPHPAPAGTETKLEKANKVKPAENGLIKLSEEAEKTAGLRLETVRFSLQQEGLTIPGTVELSPNRSAKVTPPALGKVVRMLVNPGDSVRVGQALAILDSYEVAQAHAAVRQAESSIQQAQAGVQTAQAETAQVRSSVQQAQGEIEQAQSKQASAETASNRQSDLAKAGAFSQAPLQTAQSELAEAQSGLLQAQTELQSHTVMMQRAERLFKDELISRSELEQAQLENRQDEAKVQQAKTRVESVKQTVAREQRIFQGDLLTKQAVQTAEAEVRAAKGDVQRAKQGFHRAQQDLLRAQKGEQASHTTLRGADSGLNAARTNLYSLEGPGHLEGVGGLITIAAPISGVVTERTATLIL